MPKFRVRFNGQEDLIEANTPEQAAVMARLRFAGDSPTQTLASARMGFAEKMPPESAAMGLAALPMLGVAAVPGAGVELAKDAALYGAGTVAEHFGAPSWLGEAMGMMRPANAMRKGVTKIGARLLGLGAKEAIPAVEAATAKTAATRAEELAVKKAEAEVALKQARIDDIAKKAAERAERHQEWLKAQAAKTAKAAEPPILPKSAVKVVGEEPKGKILPGKFVKAVPEEPPILPDSAVKALPDSNPGVVPSEFLPGEPGSAEHIQSLVLKIQQIEKMPGAKATIREFIAQQPPEVAAAIKAELARRQAHPATVYLKPKAAQLSGELAKLLGQ